MVDISILPKKIQNEIEEKAKKYKLSKKEKEELIKEVIKTYFKKKIDIYEPVGLITAHSISEPATQMVIDTFHFAGVAEMNIMNSLPRLIEILDARVKPKILSMNIYLKDKDLSMEELEKLAKKIKEVKFEEVIKEINLDIVENSITFRLDKKSLEEMEMDQEELIKLIKNKVKSVELEESRNKIIIKPKKKIKIKELYSLKEKIKNITIGGIKGISRIILTQDENGEYFFMTEGSNLKEILMLDFVDPKKTITNDIHEIESVLGIEAVRAYIVKEIKRIYDAQGIDVDMRHLLLIADTLTVFGEYKGITRYDLAASKNSVLAKAAFETPRKFLVEASIKKGEDNFKTVLENVLVNQLVPTGTGLIKVKYKVNKKK